MLESTTVRKDTLQKAFRTFFIYVVALAVAFGVISLILLLMGFNVPLALRTLLVTSFRSGFGFQETLKKTITLIFTTYAFAIPYWIRFFNIGGVGQMMVGGTAAAIVGLIMVGANVHPLIAITLMVMAGIAAGALFAAIAGYLQASYSINPIISTIMLNFVAVLIVNYFSTTAPWRDPVAGHPMTLRFPPEYTLQPLFGFIPFSIIFAILSVAVVYLLMRKTKLGYEIMAVGYNLHAAQTYGVSFQKTIVITFILAGGLAGLGGAMEVLTVHSRLVEGFELTSGAQYGIFGILTALIAAGNPLAIPVAAFFMSVLLVGADALQRTMQIPVEMVFLAQALIVLFLVVLRARMEVKK
ncbi:MAG: ABC transporter permease [Bacillota bacterium]|nr:ABC transporter permease [Bacillota bacterium]